ncbi:unnamed protein product [Lymnaea stagnalis]|uniref:Solute carrier family 43 member 3 n=1 Tax=Lymnaea stagnalis TaxID=6523 RepID=A0AAV2I493_LYMST
MYGPGHPKLRFFYVVWGFLECIGYGGLVLGWSSFVYVLKDEGLYMDLCGNLTDSLQNDTQIKNATEQKDSCPDRDSRLELVFTIGSSSIGVGSFVLGQINFRFGTRVMRIVAAIVFMAGSLLTAFTTNETPWLIFPGMVLLAFGGIVYIMSNVQISHLFPVGGTAVVGLLSGAFDSSAGVQVMVKLGYEGGVSRKTSYLILAFTHVLTFISTFFFLPKDFIHHAPASEELNIELELKDTDAKKYQITVENQERREEIPEVHGKDAEGNFRSLLKMIFSKTYLLHVFWFSVLQLRFYYILGSMNKALEKQLDSKSEVSHYTNILLYILMGGVFASPLIGFFVELNVKIFRKSSTPFGRDVMPTILPLTLTILLGITLSVLILMEDSSLLYVSFVILLLFRSFLYTVMTGYITRVFPSAYFGSLLGLCILAAGVIGLLQHALFEWAELRNTREVNIFLIVLVCTSFVHPAWQWYACTKAKKN